MPCVSFVSALLHVCVVFREIRPVLTVAVNAAENKKAVDIRPKTLQKFSYVIHDSPMIDSDKLLGCTRK